MLLKLSFAKGRDKTGQTPLGISVNLEIAVKRAGLRVANLLREVGAEV